MEPVCMTIGAKTGAALVTGVTTHLAVCELAAAYAHHAAAQLAIAHAATAHAATAHAGHAVAGAHTAKALHGVRHLSAHPMSRELAELLGGAATLGTLTFINLYDHILDAEWEKAKKHLRTIPVKRLKKQLNLAYQHTVIELENAKLDTVDEMRRLAQLVAQLGGTLRPLTPSAGGLAT